jgi:hypothetical protein
MIGENYGGVQNEKIICSGFGRRNGIIFSSLQEK